MDWRKTLDSILDYVFPKQCFGCGAEGEYLCKDCFTRIEYLRPDQCYFCEKPGFEKGICPACAEQTNVKLIVPACAYTDTAVGQLVESFKYNFMESASMILNKVLATQIENLRLKNHIYGIPVVPIPLHKKRYLERGFNQSEKLCDFLTKRYDSRLKSELLQRQKYTAQQAKLKRKERLANLKDCFAVNLTEKIPESVIIVDDVLTTGVTMREASQALKKAGVKNIICLAVCHG